MGNFPLSSLHKRFNSSRGPTIKLFLWKIRIQGAEKESEMKVYKSEMPNVSLLCLSIFAINLRNYLS